MIAACLLWPLSEGAVSEWLPPTLEATSPSRRKLKSPPRGDQRRTERVFTSRVHHSEEAGKDSVTEEGVQNSEVVHIAQGERGVGVVEVEESDASRDQGLKVRRRY